MFFIYKIALCLHIVAAIIGLGPTFYFPYLLKRVKTVLDAAHTIKIIETFSKLANLSDYVLLVSGIVMMWKGGFWLSQGWLNLALILFFLMRFTSKIISKKSISELFSVMQLTNNHRFSKEYSVKLNNFMPILLTVQTLTSLILLLMIIKPTISFLAF